MNLLTCPRLVIFGFAIFVTILLLSAPTSDAHSNDELKPFLEKAWKAGREAGYDEGYADGKSECVNAPPGGGTQSIGGVILSYPQVGGSTELRGDAFLTWDAKNASGAYFEMQKENGGQWTISHEAAAKLQQSTGAPKVDAVVLSGISGDQLSKLIESLKTDSSNSNTKMMILPKLEKVDRPQ